MSPAALARVLRPLRKHTHEQLIVGLQTSDDAAVFRVSADLAVVQTIDFFTPIVDDPYTFGAIAAANSMSDVYAMGGEVAFALNVVAFPDDLDPAILAEILRGGADKIAEAGAVIAGGHTIIDREPKYGLSVTGFVHPDRVWRKSGARPGDLLFLTKPIGTGVVSTALKNRAASVEDVDSAVRSMSTLNKAASEIAHAAPPNACTDITGFGLAGHGHEIAEQSGVRLRIGAGSVPLLPGALGYVSSGQQAGGLARNRDYYERSGVVVEPSIDPGLAALLFDPQTSGGLLFSVAPAGAADFLASFERRGHPIWRIGSVEPGSGVIIES